MRANLNNIDQIHNFNIDIKQREIFLHSATDSDEEGGVDFRSAISLHKNLRYLNSISYDPIVIHMHIPGGEWCDCMSMYDSIRLSPSPVGIIVYSRAESSGSIILQAADLRIMMPSSYTLIHYGTSFVDGDHKVAISNLEWSQKEAGRMVDIFTDKMMPSPLIKEKKWRRINAKKHIMSQLDNKADWILYPDQCIYYGFADGVLGVDNFSTIDDIKKYLKVHFQ
jgi:ATP-dependent protease ClpP protease subunit